MQNSALRKQSAAVNTISLILTIEVDSELGKVKGIRSAVRLRFRKSISGHHFQTIGKLASNDFNHHTEVVNSI